MHFVTAHGTKLLKHQHWSTRMNNFDIQTNWPKVRKNKLSVLARIALKTQIKISATLRKRESQKKREPQTDGFYAILLFGFYCQIGC